jgi:hypothetical protein
VHKGYVKIFMDQTISSSGGGGSSSGGLGLMSKSRVIRNKFKILELGYG